MERFEALAPIIILIILFFFSRNRSVLLTVLTAAVLFPWSLVVGQSGWRAAGYSPDLALLFTVGSTIGTAVCLVLLRLHGKK